MSHAMDSRARLLTALNRGVPDRLPATTHHLQPYFLKKYMQGASEEDFFDFFELDAIRWTLPLRSHHGNTYTDARGYTLSANWHIEETILTTSPYLTKRYHIVTPMRTLSMVTESNAYTTWVSEHLIKEKSDIDVLGTHMPAPACDVEAVNRIAGEFGERGIVRGHIPGFDIFGQPGCWQDAACLVGIERLILATYDDPAWVHTLLGVLQQRKAAFIRTLAGARFDLLELGGGDASTTVISPKLFRTFVAPYDAPLIELARSVGQRTVYHTCGGMMPILEDIADMGPAAMETFTPPDMGGDVDLAEAKRRIGHRVCMIGGFDQFHYFKDCDPQSTRAAVRRAFEAAGGNGGFILSPSDHFFDADIELIAAFADEARHCTYS